MGEVLAHAEHLKDDLSNTITKKEVVNVTSFFNKILLYHWDQPLLVILRGLSAKANTMTYDLKSYTRLRNRSLFMFCSAQEKF